MIKEADVDTLSAGRASPGSEKEADSYSYAATVSGTMCFPLPLHPMVEERVKRAFELEALIKAHSDELRDILFTRGLPKYAPRARERYSAALGILSSFMKAAGFEGMAVGEFVELALALDELDRGTVRHFLKPKKAENRPHDAGDVWGSRAYVAAAVARMMENGHPRRAASRQIAAQHKELAIFLSATSSREFYAVIESWHSDFSKGRRGILPEQYMYDALLRETNFTVAELMHSAVLAAIRAATPDAVEISKLEHAKKAPIKICG